MEKYQLRRREQGPDLLHTSHTQWRQQTENSASGSSPQLPQGTRTPPSTAMSEKTKRRPIRSSLETADRKDAQKAAVGGWLGFWDPLLCSQSVLESHHCSKASHTHAQMLGLVYTLSICSPYITLKPVLTGQSWIKTQGHLYPYIQRCYK